MVAIDQIRTGRKIKDICTEAGLTAADLQKACGLTTANAPWRWFRGDTIPSLDNLVVIADLCGKQIGDLIVTQRL